ncbi:MAG: hypothetical protein CM15mV67_060 [uncultured marine virus]|nr:MAG: hypothetical protein CM15mV67_060 [uncultured marine virus]
MGEHVKILRRINGKKKKIKIQSNFNWGPVLKFLKNKDDFRKYFRKPKKRKEKDYPAIEKKLVK